MDRLPPHPLLLPSVALVAEHDYNSMAPPTNSRPSLPPREAPFPWGDEFNPARRNTEESGIGDTTPVGQYSPDGDSPYGGAGARYSTQIISSVVRTTSTSTRTTASGTTVFGWLRPRFYLWNLKFLNSESLGVGGCQRRGCGHFFAASPIPVTSKPLWFTHSHIRHSQIRTFVNSHKE